MKILTLEMNHVTIESEFYNVKILVEYYQNITEPCERGWRNSIFAVGYTFSFFSISFA